MDLQSAARRLGMKTAEVVSIEDTADGTVVTGRDGHRVLIDHDDALWWYGAAPNPGLPLWSARTAGTTDGVNVPPVTTSSEGSDVDAAEEDEPEDSEDEAEPVPVGTRDDVLSWVHKAEGAARAARATRAWEAEVAGQARKTLVAELERIAAEGE